MTPARDPVPAERRRPGAARALMVVGAAVLLGAEVGLFLEVPPFPTWFYVFAWWAWILFADGWVHLRTGSSLLLSRTRGFALLLPWSLAFWLAYEAANFVLLNWYYVAVPADRGERLVGIAVSFATVLPGMLETVDLLRSFGVGERARGRGWRPGPRVRAGLFAAGLAFLVLPLLFPLYAYPLIWGALVLLVEPVLARDGRRGFLTQFARGQYGNLVRFLLAGLVCGILWEFWNFWSRAKWIYTVPFFEEGKLFEMPVLGFLGYPPFALSIYSFTRALIALGLVPELEREQAEDLSPRPNRTPYERELLGVATALFLATLVLPGVERRTVRSTAPRVEELLRLPEHAALARTLVGDDFDAVVAALREPELPRELGMTEHERTATLREARLLRLAGMGRRGVAWLESVDVYDVDDLAQLAEDELLTALRDRGSGPAPEPYPREVRVWLRRARSAEGAPPASGADD